MENKHYFIYDPTQKDREKQIQFKINNIQVDLVTNSGLFSKDHFDRGTQFLLENIDTNLENINTILDLGCGYGPIGIYLKKLYPHSKVVMCDINEKAVKQTLKNINLNNLSNDNVECFKSDLFSNIDNTKYKFDLIVTNPPIRTGKENVFNLYQNSLNYLTNNGILYIVVGIKQGAKSHIKFLQTLFNNVISTKIKEFYTIKCCNF